MPVAICSECKKQIRDSYHEQPVTDGWCNCLATTNLTLKDLRRELLEEFRNGNLKHTFNEKVVNDYLYVDTFLRRFREE